MQGLPSKEQPRSINIFMFIFHISGFRSWHLESILSVYKLMCEVCIVYGYIMILIIKMYKTMFKIWTVQDKARTNTKYLFYYNLGRQTYISEIKMVRILNCVH